MLVTAIGKGLAKNKLLITAIRNKQTFLQMLVTATRKEPAKNKPLITAIRNKQTFLQTAYYRYP